MMRSRHVLLFWAAVAICSAQLIEANTLFQFSLRFHVKSADDTSAEVSAATDAFKQTIAVRNDEISLRDNNDSSEKEEEETSTAHSDKDAVANSATNEPHEVLWLKRQNRVMPAALAKVVASHKAVVGLSAELASLVGRSDDIAAAVKLATRYANEWAAKGGNHFDVLRKFTHLVEQLQVLASDDGERSPLEQKLLQLALDKYRLLQLRDEVQQEVLLPEQTWQHYKQKRVEVGA